MRLLLAAFAAVPMRASAQTYPDHPVRVIVPWPPGQATDIAARLVAERLQAGLGQAFVIETGAQPYGWYESDGIDARSGTAPAKLEFVFRIDLPDGTTLWDNRAGQNYEVSGHPAW